MHKSSFLIKYKLSLNHHILNIFRVLAAPTDILDTNINSNPTIYTSLDAPQAPLQK